MLASKTIKCRVWKPTNRKKEALETEYSRVQDFYDLKDWGLEFLPLYKDLKVSMYSATSQDIHKEVYGSGEKDRNWYIRNQNFKVERSENSSEFDWWATIPVGHVYGGVTVPIKPHTEIKNEWNIKDSKIVKKEDYFELHVSVEFEVKPQQDFQDVLAVDLGEKTAATAVLSSDKKPRFYGQDIRGIRRHYAWLRKRLQTKGCIDKFEEISDKESRTVEHRLHEISRNLIRLARKHESVLVLGDVKDLDSTDSGKGKKFNRILNTWARGKLREMIEYKAREQGIPVVAVNEAYTSQTCHKCGSRDTSRPSQGRFKCNSCGLDHYNADANGARNILKRFLAYMVGNGADVTLPETQASGNKEKELVEVSNLEMSVDDLRSPVLQVGE